MERLLNVMTFFSLALFVAVLASVRRAHIRVEYSVSWLAASVILFILSRSHWMLNRLTAVLGLNDAGVALIIMVFSVFLVVFFRFSMVISDLKDSNIAMAQRVAILEYRIESLHEPQTE